MPITNPHGWRTRAQAAAYREQVATERQAIRKERNRLKVEQEAARRAGVQPEPLFAPQVPAKEEDKSGPEFMTIKELREALLAAGVTVPLSTAKVRLVELYKEKIPKPPPEPPPPDTIPALPPEE